MKSFAVLVVVVGLLAIGAYANQYNKKYKEKDIDLSQPSRPNPLLHPNLAGRARAARLREELVASGHKGADVAASRLRDHQLAAKRGDPLQHGARGPVGRGVNPDTNGPALGLREATVNRATRLPQDDAASILDAKLQEKKKRQ